MKLSICGIEFEPIYGEVKYYGEYRDKVPLGDGVSIAIASDCCAFQRAYFELDCASEDEVFSIFAQLFEVAYKEGKKHLLVYVTSSEQNAINLLEVLPFARFLTEHPRRQGGGVAQLWELDLSELEKA